MAYGDDIDALNPDHRYSFENTYNDQVGSANGTNSGCDFVTTPVLCEGNTYCMRTNDITDRVTLPSTTTINNSAQTRKAVAGWFRMSAIQNPPKRVYGEGDATQSFAFLVGWGNNIVFEVDSASFTLQIFGDTFLAPNRTYHLCMIFEGNGYGNELRAYLDGIEQTAAEPSDRKPDAATLAARTAGEFGDPAGTVAMGGTAVILIAPINGYYAQWAIWDGADAILTDTEVREELFAKGAIALNTISGGTESAMQTALDAYADDVIGDVPLGFAVEDSTSGDFTLVADNITFNSKCSLHIRYEGNDTLTWVNDNGGDAVTAIATGGGTVVIQNRVTVTITVKDNSTGTVISGARVYIEADTGGSLTAGTVIMNTTTNVSGIATATVDLSASQPIIGRVRLASPAYKTGQIGGPITLDGLNETILLVGD
jgi:hypothetical protein